ncbi:MAG: hypothetical protein O2973_03650 [Gemmatimonadetes bacterium]|nr:hypothetical protein [Gemmatimonadota bacterium]
MGDAVTWTPAYRRIPAALRLAFVAAIIAALAPTAQIAAQTVLPPALVQAQRMCDGDTITTIDIRSHPPSGAGLAAATEQAATSRLGLTYVPTRHAVIAAYLRLTSGTVCTEFDRSESERLLRAQPFIASATIQAIREGPGRARLQVDVVDELRLVADARTRHGTVSALKLGSGNFSGRGLSLVAGVRRGFAYRGGFSIDAAKYGMFGRPDVLTVAAERRPVIGERLSFELAEPFLTDLQVRAFHTRAQLLSGYATILRPVGDEASVFVRRTSYDIGAVWRLGRAGGSRPVGLAGLAFMGEDVRSGNDLVIVADTGLVAGPVNAFGSRYADFSVTRLAAIGGVRALRFTTVAGFDALTAEQDMGIGVQVDALVGPSIYASGHSDDILVATDLYAGMGNATSFFTARALMEARSGRSRREWDGAVMSGRLSWYGKDGIERTHLVSLDFSAVHALVFPAQLSLRDPEGGLPGYADATTAGGQRAIVRVEERRVLRSFGARGELAASAFVAAGKLWASDVPYGAITGILGSAGVSLLGAYPSGGKRTYRVDLVLPFNPARAGTRFEVRLSVSDRTRLFWLEPHDVARARSGAVPVSLMKW